MKNEWIKHHNYKRAHELSVAIEEVGFWAAVVVWLDEDGYKVLVRKSLNNLSRLCIISPDDMSYQDWNVGFFTMRNNVVVMKSYKHEFLIENILDISARWEHDAKFVENNF